MMPVRFLHWVQFIEGLLGLTQDQEKELVCYRIKQRLLNYGNRPRSLGPVRRIIT